MFKSNFIYYSSFTYAKLFLNFLVVIPALTYYLTSEDYGIFGLIAVLFSSLGAIINTGVTWIIHHSTYLQSNEDVKSRVPSFVVFSLGIRLTIVLFVLGNVELTSRYLFPGVEADIRALLEIFSAIFILGLFWDIASPMLVIKKQARYHSTSEFAIWLINPSTALISLYFFDVGVLSLFYGFLASSILSCFLSMLYFLHIERIAWSLSKRYLTETLKSSLSMSGMSISELLSSASERFFLARFFGVGDTGIYVHSLSYKGLMVEVNRSYRKTVSPFMIEQYSNAHSLTPRLKKVNTIWYGVIGLMSLPIVLFSHEVVGILTHDKFTQAADIFPVWVIFILSIYYGLNYSSFLNSRNKIKDVSVYSITVGLFSLLVIGLLTYHFGLLGVAIGALLYNISLQLGYMYLAKKYGCQLYGEKEFAFISLVVLLSWLVNENFSTELEFLYMLSATFLIEKKYKVVGWLIGQIALLKNSRH